MNRRVVLPVLVVFALAPGCAGGGGEAGGEESVGPVGAPDHVRLDCYSSDLTVEIEGGTAASWRLGFARPSQDWLDEGCLHEGDVCHTLDADGGVIEQKGSFCDDPEDGGSCIPGGYHYAGVMTYVLEPTVGTGCWVWGSDVGYYDSLDCDTPSGWYDSCTG